MGELASTKVTIRGDTVHLLRGGAGKRVLVLHGEEGIEAVQPLLERLARQFEVIAPEHPGFGGRDKPDWLETVSDLANFHLDLIEQLDFRDLHLVGLSLGGWAAAELAIRNAGRLASLTLVGAAGLHLPGVKQVDPFAVTEEQRLRSLICKPNQAEAAIAQLLRPESEDIRLMNALVVAKLCWQPRYHDPLLAKWLHRIRVPTLIAWGAEDRLFPSEYASEWQRLIPGAELALLQGCGHLPALEQPDALAAAFASFVAKEKVPA